MYDSNIQITAQILNTVWAVVFIYCLFSIPAQIIRRFRLKKQGKSVSPVLLIVKKFFKYWFFTALILIPIASIVSYLVLSNAGVSDAEIFGSLVVMSIGNVFKSLFFGYVAMKKNKHRWSYSALEMQSMN